MSDFEQKQTQIQTLLAKKQLDALLLKRVSSFAWATDGAASYVNTAAGEGAASLLIMPGTRYVITNNIEATRLEQEEQLAAQGWELIVAPWYEVNTLAAQLSAGLNLGADVSLPNAADLSGDLARLRARLTPAEGERFRELGKICAQAINETIHAVKPGQTEFEIAALLGYQAQRRGVQPIVNLIATDERVFKFRHPLPTVKPLDKYAMLVLCGRKWGLVCSITRLVHFGKLPDELRRKTEAVAHIDATFIAATRPGHMLGHIFEQAVSTYVQTGFADEWPLHHQGGPAGYEPREYLATPASSDIVVEGQAYAWNPSITGTKSEDTILVGEADNEVLTIVPDWPKIEVWIKNQSVKRPVILEIL